MDWKEEYKKRLVSAEDAVKAVKSGDYVVFAQPEAPALGLALVRRAGDISGVKIMGGGGMVFGTVIWVVAILLLVYAWRMSAKGVLR